MNRTPMLRVHETQGVAAQGSARIREGRFPATVIFGLDGKNRFVGATLAEKWKRIIGSWRHVNNDSVVVITVMKRELLNTRVRYLVKVAISSWIKCCDIGVGLENAATQDNCTLCKRIGERRWIEVVCRSQRPLWVEAIIRILEKAFRAVSITRWMKIMTTSKGVRTEKN